jgi:predicted RNA-binding Zn-ribbon protein involved in translation (DUF1610 family)
MPKPRLRKLDGRKIKVLVENAIAQTGESEKTTNAERKASLAEGEGAEAEVIRRPYDGRADLQLCLPRLRVCLQSCSVEDAARTARPSSGCLTCGRALAPRDDGFLLKYFRIARRTNAGRRHSQKRAKDTVGVALCPDCGFVGIISRAAEDDRGEFIYRCEECQLALERSAKSCARTAADR